MAGDKYAPVRPGETRPPSATVWNEMLLMLRDWKSGRLGISGPGRPAQLLRPVQLREPLTRSTSAAAKRIAWDNGGEEDWAELNETLTVYGDLFRGYGFADDRLWAAFEPTSQRWCATGAGHFFVRGKIGNDPGGGPTELQSGGTAPLDVWKWNEDTDLWEVTDPLKTITIREAIGIEEPIPTGDLVLATWHEQGQFWIASHQPCPEA